MDQLPFTDDTVIFGLLCLCLGFVFYTSSIKTGFWSKFYNVVPTVLMCYLLPAILASVGIVDESSSKTYLVAKEYLLPAALILMTLSVDLKAILDGILELHKRIGSDHETRSEQSTMRKGIWHARVSCA